MRLDGEPPRRELLQQLMLRVHRQLLAGRLDVETEDLQLAAAGDLGVELAQGTRGGVAGIRERGLPRPLALLVQLREARLRDIDFAAHFHPPGPALAPETKGEDRKSTRLNSSHLVISYAVFCLKKKNKRISSPHA